MIAFCIRALELEQNTPWTQHLQSEYYWFATWMIEWDTGVTEELITLGFMEFVFREVEFLR